LFICISAISRTPAMAASMWASVLKAPMLKRTVPCSLSVPRC